MLRYIADSGSQPGEWDYREADGVPEAGGWAVHFVAESELGGGGLVKSLDLMMNPWTDLRRCRMSGGMT